MLMAARLVIVLLAPVAGANNYQKIKAGVECGSPDMNLGNKPDLQACADACAAEHTRSVEKGEGMGCDFFIFGFNDKAGNCWVEYSASASCPKGWEVDQYDFYQRVSAPAAPPPPPAVCPDGWGPVVAGREGVVGSKCYKHVGSPMSQPSCKAACAAEGGSMLCISSIEENDGVFDRFVDNGYCEDSIHDSCVWLGLENSVDNRDDTYGMRYHWDTWSNGCASQYRDWDRSQPNGGISYYSKEDQNCVVMGFYNRPQWWDVNCTTYLSRCVCETGANPSPTGGGGGGAIVVSGGDGGGCISGFGVFMLIVLFGAMFAYGGYLYAKPEKVAEIKDKLADLKARLGGMRGGRTMPATTSRSSVSRAGLAANDTCSSYVAPTTTPLPGMTHAMTNVLSGPNP